MRGVGIGAFCTATFSSVFREECENAKITFARARRVDSRSVFPEAAKIDKQIARSATMYMCTLQPVINND